LASSAGWKLRARRRIQRWVSFTGLRKRTRMRRSVETARSEYTTAGRRRVR
jgi:hypothetical protein